VHGARNPSPPERHERHERPWTWRSPPSGVIGAVAALGLIGAGAGAGPGAIATALVAGGPLTAGAAGLGWGGVAGGRRFPMVVGIPVRGWRTPAQTTGPCATLVAMPPDGPPT
jgi:hypothetical protein